MIGLFVLSGVTVVVLLACLLLSDRAPYFNLRGKRALITGGSSGIGLATARALVRAGCSVSIVARSAERLKKAEIELQSCAAHGAKVVAISADVSSASAVSTAVEQTVSKLGGIDVLITSAGASKPGHFLQLSSDDFENLMRANYLGSVYAARAVIPYMKHQGGRILFISSMAGQAGIFGYSAYSPSKFAVRALAEVLHMEFRHFKIFFTVVNPPDVDTPMLAQENEIKPEECRLISEGAGLFTAEQVATSIVAAIQRWRFFVSNGVDGFFLARLTAGMAPSSGFFATLFEVVFGGVLRVVGLAYLFSYQSICSRCARQRDSGRPKNS